MKTKQIAKIFLCTFYIVFSSSILFAQNDLWALVKNDDKWYYIDTTGKRMLTCPGKECNSFSSGLAPVYNGSKWGYMDKTGKMVILPTYKKAKPFVNGAAILDEGYLRPDGSLIEVPTFDALYNFSEGIAKIRNNKSYALLSLSGKFLSDFDFSLTEECSEGLISVRNNGNWFYLDQNGKTVLTLPNKITYAKEFHDGWAMVRMADGDWNYINKSGKFISKEDFMNVFEFSEGLALVRVSIPKVNASGTYVPQNSESYLTFIDTTGKEKIKINVDAVKSFKNGLAMAKSGDKWGYIDKNGKWAIKPLYKNASNFVNGFAWVRTDKRWFFINRAGKRISEEEFEIAKDFLVVQ